MTDIMYLVKRFSDDDAIRGYRPPQQVSRCIGGDLLRRSTGGNHGSSAAIFTTLVYIPILQYAVVLTDSVQRTTVKSCCTVHLGVNGTM